MGDSSHDTGSSPPFSTQMQYLVSGHWARTPDIGYGAPTFELAKTKECPWKRVPVHLELIPIFEEPHPRILSGNPLH